MDELPRDEWPYGVDTIRLRMTWPARRRWVSDARWDIAQGAIPSWAVAARPLARSPDAGVVRVADEEEEERHEREQERELGPPGMPGIEPRRDVLSPDLERPPPLNPLLPPGVSPLSPLGGAVGLGGGRSVAPRPSTPQVDPTPGTPEQKLRLRREMEKAEQIERNDGNEAHHMVPQSGRNMSGQRDPSAAQRILQRFDIDLNSVENGAALSMTFHRRIHTNEYYAYVERSLQPFRTREGVVNWLSHFREQLRDADREFQQSGQLPSWITGATP